MRTLASFVFVFLAACSSSSSTDKGSPPVITDVTLDKTEIAIGKIETIQATVTFTDADGDVVRLEQQLTAGGTSQAPDAVDIPEASGQKQGSHAFAIAIGAPSAGTADLAFWLVDAQGNESAHVTRTVTAK